MTLTASANRRVAGAAIQPRPFCVRPFAASAAVPCGDGRPRPSAERSSAVFLLQANPTPPFYP